MNVLVTGHKGYIGSRLTDILFEEGYNVNGLDSNLFSQCQFGKQTPIDVSEKEMDIRDVKHEDLIGFDAIIHLAGLSNDPLGNFNPKLTDEINNKATIKLATYAKEVGVKRFLFSSSCSNYGAANGIIVDENSRLNPVTAYGNSKVDAERGLSNLCDSNFCVAYFRCATAYGVSNKLRFDLVLNNLTAYAFSTSKIFLKSDGTSWRPLVHVEDICWAFLAGLCANDNLINNVAINIGSTSENFSVKEIANIVKEVMPSCNIVYDKNPIQDKRSYQVRFDRLKDLLNYETKWTIKLGVEELLHNFKSYPVDFSEFEGHKYSRIKHLEKMVENGELDEDLRKR